MRFAGVLGLPHEALTFWTGNEMLPQLRMMGKLLSLFAAFALILVGSEFSHGMELKEWASHIEGYAAPAHSGLQEDTGQGSHLVRCGANILALPTALDAAPADRLWINGLSRVRQ